MTAMKLTKYLSVSSNVSQTALQATVQQQATSSDTAMNLVVQSEWVVS